MPRLVTAEEVDGWRQDISDAIAAASDRQRHAMTAMLKANGLKWDSPRSEVTTDLWSQTSWVDAVTTEVEPVARRAAKQIVALLRARVDNKAHWGMGDPTDALVAMVVDKTLSAAPKLGARLGLVAAGASKEAIAKALGDAKIAMSAPARYGGVTHPAAQPTILDEYQARFAELDRIAARVGGHMSDAASQLLAETAADHGPGVEYVWTAVGDERTRPDHLDADGQVVPAGTAFDVGGEELMYPGDPNGSDENVDNCRCWLEVEGVDLDRDFEQSLAMDLG